MDGWGCGIGLRDFRRQLGVSVHSCSIASSVARMLRHLYANSLACM
jgi:hypothetical protein